MPEREVVDWTKRYLEHQGLEVHEDDAGSRIGGNANNLIVWLRGNRPQGAWTVNGEADLRAVLAGGWSLDYLTTDTPEVAERVIRG